MSKITRIATITVYNGHLHDISSRILAIGTRGKPDLILETYLTASGHVKCCHGNGTLIQVRSDAGRSDLVDICVVQYIGRVGDGNARN